MLTMPQEADFCGDRLRLSAFLRVVGNGMPKRPTRFRRRVPVTDDSLEPSTHFETTQEASTDAKTVFGKCLTKVPNVDPASSRVPEQPNSMSDNLFTAPETDNEGGAGFETHEDVEFVKLPPRLKERNPTAKTLTSKEPLKVSKHQRKRRLPVNKLALLRTTSSDGLPLPSVRSYLAGRYCWLELTRALRTLIVHLRRLWPSLIQLPIRVRICHMRQFKIRITHERPKLLRSLRRRNLLSLSRPHKCCEVGSAVLVPENSTAHAIKSIRDMILLHDLTDLWVQSFE